MFTIVIKQLKTEKKKSNCLSLGREVLKVINVQYDDVVNHAFSIHNATFETTSNFLFVTLVNGFKDLHEEMDDDAIEGTNGIWQVSNTTHSIKLHIIVYIIR